MQNAKKIQSLKALGTKITCLDLKIALSTCVFSSFERED